MTPVSDGLRISIDDPEVKRFRASIIEWLMLNHPHDCPVCDEGGECHLQDMTVMTGHVYRKTRFKKRTYRNQDLGPFVNHEMNRCIQCYRCVRFYRDFAGGRDLNVFSAHDRVYFGRYKDGLLESEFSGNLVEICPTGVFTDKTLKKHYTRPWDLQCAPSICVHCSLGCNTLPGERHGTLRRVRNRFNDEVNGYFLCDRGRYGYEFVNSPDRIRKPVLKTSDSAGIAGHAHPEDVQKYLRERFHFGTRAIGIGSPKASLEANYALRTLVGPESFYLGVSATDYRLVTLIASILKSGPVPAASLKDIAHSDAVLILGEDVTNTAPLAALALRQTIRQKPMKLVDEARLPRWNQMAADYVIQDSKGPLFVATPEQTKLDDIASGIYRAAPPDLAHFGFAIAYELLGKAPLASPSSRETGLLIDNIASALKEAERPLIVCGTGCKNEAVIQAAANIAWALNSIGGNAGLCYIVPECNSMGLGLIGGGSIEEAFYEIDSLQAETLVMIESDLDRLTEKSASDSFLTKFKHVIIIDSLPSETGSKAELLLPAATFAESDGTFVNNEGRAQRFYKVIAQSGEVRENWRWLIEMLKAAGNREAAAWNTIDDINKSMAEDLPVFGKVLQIAPPAGFRISGMKIPRQPNRYSGRTAMYANMSVHEPQSPDDTDSPLAFSMEGYEGVPPSSLVAHYWVPGWNSVQAIDKYQREVGGPLKWGNPGIRLLEPSTVTSPNYFQPGIFREAPSHTGATNGGRAVGRKKKS
jgi:NADH-quinone oxidoreductase subunit G